MPTQHCLGRRLEWRSETIDHRDQSIADDPNLRVQCAELCGMDHGYMPIVVEVVEPDAYEAWVAARQSGGAQVAQLEN